MKKTIGAVCLFLASATFLAQASEELDFANGLFARKMYGPAVGEYEKFVQTHPDSPELPSARFRAAECYFFLKNDEKSVFYFEQFLKDFPSDAKAGLAQLRLGTAYFNLKKYDESAETLTQAFQKSEDPAVKAGSLFYQAKTQTALGRTERAKVLLEKLTANFSSSPYAAYAAMVIGDGLVKEGNLEAALEKYRQVSKAGSPEMAAEAGFKIAEIYFEKKEYAKARAAYEKLSLPESTPWKQPIFEALFYCDIYLKDYESAKKRLENKEALEKSTLKNEILFLAGTIYSTEKNYEAANDYYVRALEGEGRSKAWAHEALYKDALALDALGRRDAAGAVYSSLTQDYPKSAFAPRALLELIQMELEKKNYARAIARGREFVERYPQSEWIDLAHYKMALAYTAAGDPAQAQKSFEALLVASPFSKLYGEALYGAATNALKTGDNAKALAHFEQFVKVYPSNVLVPAAKSPLAVLYFETKQFDSAAKIIEESILKTPTIQITSKQSLWLCRYLLDKGEYSRMQSVLEAAKKRFESENLLHEFTFFEAETQMGLKNPAKALELYTQSLEAAPQGPFAPHALLGQGVAYAAQNDFVKAEENFNKAQTYGLPAVSCRARFEIASIRLRAGDMAEAAKAFMLVAVLYDDAKYSPVALYKAGECFTALGQTQDATQAFGELKKRYPENEWAKKVQGFAG